MPEPAEEAVRVTCPGCKMIMLATDRKPVLFSRGLVQVTYRCEPCGTETMRARTSRAASVGGLGLSAPMRKTSTSRGMARRGQGHRRRRTSLPKRDTFKQGPFGGFPTDRCDMIRDQLRAEP